MEVLCIKTILLNYIFLKAGEIAVELVKEGLATCKNSNMKLLEKSVDKLRAAERQAKEKKLNIWHKHREPEVLIIS